MSISLVKGQKIDLTKGNDLKRGVIGLGWDINNYDGGDEFDLDASAFLVSTSGKAENDLDFIFYNNLKHPSGSVIHTGDNRTGEGEGDDEQIIIEFAKIPTQIDRIAITVTIHDAVNRKQNFGQVSNAFVRVFNEESNEELLRYDLTEDYSVETAMVVCELYRHGDEWKFNAIGSGFQGGLGALCRNYGLDA
ncbi:TerD family protein [Helicovermis profundi]|uniref:TerD family protein n=1 Tax=Helicovermis profundi TaxID=3065157 RepID=A0AAU9ENK8_9FIRM|nr:TerD family protein [Clostridia bacterium S502]